MDCVRTSVGKEVIFFSGPFLNRVCVKILRSTFFNLKMPKFRLKAIDFRFAF